MTSSPFPPAIRSALIVDDLRFNRTLLRHALTSLGYTITEACNGDEAIQHLNAKPFDVVFLDWELPGTNKGDQVARHLRSLALQADTRVIAITSDTSDAMRLRCAQAGTNAFLGKTLDTNNVKEAILSAGLDHSARPHPDVSALIRNKLANCATYFAGGMPEAIHHCREEFIAEQSRLHVAKDASQWSDAARAAHNLGALAAMIGWPEMHDSAHLAEDALRGADRSTLPARLAQLDHFIESARVALSSPDAG